MYCPLLACAWYRAIGEKYVRLIGKVTGLGAGYLLGGPFGALVGAAMGHQLFDRPPRELFGVPISNREVKNSVFFVATFSMLGKLAQADGEVSEEEIASVEGLVRSHFKLSWQSAKFAFKTFDEAVVSNDSFESHARTFHDQFADSPDVLVTMLEIMLLVAHADSVYDESEEFLIKSAAAIFGLDDEYEHILHLFKYQPDNLEHCYDLLGCEASDDTDAIRERYEHLLEEHDPDVLIENGVPKELTNLAEEKRKLILLAFEQILRSRGLPHDGEDQ
ncbi:MAG: hypothetical protein CMQ19_09840 [Gammaproteobacteria bacterium]|nr:hypothetical protein [Gammaproteobacteria bacterium]